MIEHRVMLILRGITGTFDGAHYPHGALDEPPALAYATRRGYVGQVLDVSGEAYDDSPQVRLALAHIHADQTIKAIYGFSGGGYNVRHILDHLHPDERNRMRLVVVLGAPGNPPALYEGPWELVYRLDPPEGHMAGPKELLAALIDTEGQFG